MLTDNSNGKFKYILYCPDTGDNLPLIDHIAKEQGCDVNRVSITRHSLGASSTLDIHRTTGNKGA